MSIKIIDRDATSSNLKHLMDEAKLTPRMVQEKLLLGSVQAVYKWFQTGGKTLPSLDNLVILSDVLSCSIEDILVTTEVTI